MLLTVTLAGVDLYFSLSHVLTNTTNFGGTKSPPPESPPMVLLCSQHRNVVVKSKRGVGSQFAIMS